MQEDITIAAAQADMRSGYLSGAPGIVASSAAWLTAAAVAFSASFSAAVWTLLVAGAFIHPVGVLLAKLLGAPGKHRADNPMAGLAVESTFWMLAGILVAIGISLHRIEWFFPAMLLVIGGRYLTFRTIYGLAIYWLLGAALCMAAVGLVFLKAPVPLSALVGGLLELGFAAVLLKSAPKSAA